MPRLHEAPDSAFSICSIIEDGGKTAVLCCAEAGKPKITPKANVASIPDLFISPLITRF